MGKMLKQKTIVDPLRAAAVKPLRAAPNMPSQLRVKVLVLVFGKLSHISPTVPVLVRLYLLGNPQVC